VASKEQSTGVQEINRAIVQMETVTQQNAALVEEATAATASFEEEAGRLSEAVARFKFTAAERASAGAGAAPSALPSGTPAQVLAFKPKARVAPGGKEGQTRARAIAAPKRADLPSGKQDGEEWQEF
jgi:hypothetical protein